MHKENAWSGARNLLLVRMDTLGDILMTSPAIRAVRENLPASRLTLLTSSGGGQAAALLPELDRVMVHDPPWMKATPQRNDGTVDRRFIRHLRRMGFDAAIIFTVFSQSPLPAAMLCQLADIPLRLAHCRENPYQLLTHWVQETDEVNHMRHEVQRQLDLVATVGFTTPDPSMRVPVDPRMVYDVEQRLTNLGLDRSRPWMVVHPGASAPSRRWHPQGFAAAAARMTAEDEMQIVFTGSVAEIDLVEGIRSHMVEPGFSLAGQLNLEELAALLWMTPVILTNNTGPAHLAAAVGTPVVDLYALTNPQHTPWMVPNQVLFHDVPCRNCFKSVCPLVHHNCLRLVSVDEVVAAVRSLYRYEWLMDEESPGKCAHSNESLLAGD